MAKTLTKAWGNYKPGTALTADREDLAESPAGTLLVHATRMEALEKGGYFAPVKAAAPEVAKAATLPPAATTTAAPSAPAPAAPPAKAAPAEPKPAEGKLADG